ncbi:uncharacterized protein LOC127720092 [Mytilus californianus]|uniref:uncharacterized protein LOC127720092 n=1 Tax=Mytilus californianus TaxID=6549 RepID=UPI0022466E11|nr:uncharacterized protein LOC127720092 [Mytilus californianus]
MAYFKLTILVITVFIGLTHGPVHVSCQLGFPPGIGLPFGGLPPPVPDLDTAETEFFLIQEDGLTDGVGASSGGFSSGFGGGLGSLLSLLLVPFLLTALIPRAAPAAAAAPAAPIVQLIQPLQIVTAAPTISSTTAPTTT